MRSVRFLLVAALLSGCAGSGPGAQEANERALLSRIKQHCYTTAQGQAVYYTDAVGCPDQALIEAESARLNKRIGMSHPKILSGSSIIFTEFVPCYYGVDVPATGRARGCNHGYDIYVDVEGWDRNKWFKLLMHEDCHYIRRILGLDFMHDTETVTNWRTGETRQRQTTADKHFYDACEALGVEKQWSWHLEHELKRMERFQ